MIPLPEAQKAFILTQEELDALLPHHAHIPADVRESMRVKLQQFPIAARHVYNREGIRSPETPLINVIETVLYHFDENNRERVADALEMNYDEFVLFLVGYVLGHEGR